MRLPVDRHFTVAGFGTVVTGTLLSGSVRAGDTVEVLPPGKAGAGARGAGPRQESGAGLRRPAGRPQPGRPRPGADPARHAWSAPRGSSNRPTAIDVRLTLLPDAPRPLKFRDPVHFYLGTARVVGIVALLDRDQLEPGESALVQIHLDRPLVAHRQDRFIIRSYSPMTTIGGGTVIDPAPVKHRRFRKEVMAALAELESGEKSFLLQKLAAQRCAKVKELETALRPRHRANRRPSGGPAAEGKVTALAEQWATAEALRAWRHTRGGDRAASTPPIPFCRGFPTPPSRRPCPATSGRRPSTSCSPRRSAEGELGQQGEWLRLPGLHAHPRPRRRPGRSPGSRKPTDEAGPLAKNKREMLDQLGPQRGAGRPLLRLPLRRGTVWSSLNEESFLHADTYRRGSTCSGPFRPERNPHPGRVPRPTRQRPQAGAGPARTLRRAQVHHAQRGCAGGVETAGRQQRGTGLTRGA